MARKPARSRGCRSNEPAIRRPATARLSAALQRPAGPARPQNAVRIDLTLGGPQSRLGDAPNFAKSAAPAFRAKAGCTVVLALTIAPVATAFHLHGHHFRLLDRLDDGRKPLAGQVGGRTRSDPADRVFSRICRALADREHRDGLGGTPPRAVVQCRVRKPE